MTETWLCVLCSAARGFVAKPMHVLRALSNIYTPVLFIYPIKKLLHARELMIWRKHKTMVFQQFSHQRIVFLRKLSAVLCEGGSGK